MTQPLGLTTGRMLGAAALAGPYFGALFTTALVCTSLISSLLSPAVGGFAIAPIEIVSWLLYGFIYSAGFGAVAAVMLGFPLSLLGRRLLRHAHRQRTVALVAFFVGVVAAGLTIALASPLLFMNIGSADPGGDIAYVTIIELAAGCSAALAWVTLWRVSPERSAARSAAGDGPQEGRGER